MRKGLGEGQRENKALWLESQLERWTRGLQGPHKKPRDKSHLETPASLRESGAI